MPHVANEFLVLDPCDEQPQRVDEGCENVVDMIQENFVDEGLFYDTQFMAGWAELR